MFTTEVTSEHRPGVKEHDVMERKRAVVLNLILTTSLSAGKKYDVPLS
jgi:hypothetical protein